MGGSDGWVLGWGIGKWQSVESWQACQLLELCFLEGKEAGSLSRGRVPVENEKMKDLIRWSRNKYLFDKGSSSALV